MATTRLSSKARKARQESTKVSSAIRKTSDNNEEPQEPQDNQRLPWYTVYTKSDSEYDRYMSTEWGMEKRGDVALFEKLSLEGAQAGLSWLTILRKREAYRKVFYNFDIEKVAQMSPQDVQRILDTQNDDPSNIVVRHRGKIEATINNAKCIQAMYEEEAAANFKKTTKNNNLFDRFLWSFVNDKPILNTKWKVGQSLATALCKTPESEAMSKALKQRGFRFVGPTTCYAMMQSCGLVIDHPVGSPEWKAAVERLKKRPGGYQKDTDKRGNNNNNEETSKNKAKSRKK